MTKGQRKSNGSFALSESPSHLLKRCAQFFGDLYAHEAGSGELTKQQFTLLAALEHNDGVSQTALVEITGIDRSTLAEMIRRMIERGLLDRERTESDQRANAVRIAVAGKKALRSARTANERVERALLAGLAAADRARLVKMLAIVVAQAEFQEGDSRPGEGRTKPRRSR